MERASVEPRQDAVLRLVEATVHDGRNALNGMSINLEMLQERLAGLDGPSVRWLGAIRTQIGKLDRLLSNLLRLSGAAPGDGPVDLGALVQQAVEACGLQAKRGRVVLQTELRPVTVEASSAAIAVAILELMHQQIDANPGGKVTVGLEERGPDAVLSVRADEAYREVSFPLARRPSGEA